MSSGVVLDDGVKTQPAVIHVVVDEPGRTVLEITLHEGRNRQIRNMCEAVGLEVARLKRTAIGAVKLGMLPQGRFRDLTPDEVRRLRAAAQKKGNAQNTQREEEKQNAERCNQSQRQQRDHPVNLTFFPYFSALFLFRHSVFINCIHVFCSFLLYCPIQLIFLLIFSDPVPHIRNRTDPVHKAPKNRQFRSGHLPASGRCQAHTP
mgnify:CR=1 FL=1